MEEKSSLATKYLGSEIVGLVRSKTPREFILKRPIGGGGTAQYVPGWRFVERLNECFGFLWSYEIPEHFIDGDHIVSLGRLSIKVPQQSVVIDFPDGRRETRVISECTIVKQQFGGSEIKRYEKPTKTHSAGDMIDLANDYKASATDALKKCSIELGIFADVYASSGEETGPSEEQLEALYMRGLKVFKTREEVDKWCSERIGKLPKDCEPAEVLGLIPVLIRLVQEKAGTRA